MKIVIIGAGAAGMMAVATLLEKGTPGSDIILIEKNPKLGVKVALTGGGRCNVTTGITKRQELFSKYIRGTDFLKHSFEIFGPRRVFQWFENNGLPLYIQEDNRVFPRTNKGQDVVETFDALFSAGGVQLRLGEGVKNMRIASTENIIPSGVETFIEKEKKESYHSNIFQPNGSGHFLIETEKGVIESDILMIATGGNAYVHTGSSGDGYSFAQMLGHTITPLGPSLNSFEVVEDWCKDLSGISLPNARLSVIASVVKQSLINLTSSEIASLLHSLQGHISSVSGPLLFTHFGISGPATFALSAHIAFEKIEENHLITVGISIDTNKDFQTWDNEIRSACEKESSKLVKNILSNYIPIRLAEVILNIIGIDKERTGAHLSKDDRKKIVHMLTGQLKVTLVRRRPGDEFVTAGGISLEEVDPKTMQSKIVSGLYFGGEVLDIDGVTGGFNLQSAWATGRAAGEAIYDSFFGNQ